MSDIFHAVQRIGAWVRDYGSEKNPEFIADIKVLLGLGEAAIRNESDVPLDEEWLRSVGFEESHDETIACQIADTVLVTRWGFEFTVCNARPDIKTRGDVRRLCAALGIPLSEPSP